MDCAEAICRGQVLLFEEHAYRVRISGHLDRPPAAQGPAGRPYLAPDAHPLFERGCGRSLRRPTLSRQGKRPPTHEPRSVAGRRPGSAKPVPIGVARPLAKTSGLQIAAWSRRPDTPPRPLNDPPPTTGRAPRLSAPSLAGVRPLGARRQPGPGRRLMVEAEWQRRGARAAKGRSAQRHRFSPPARRLAAGPRISIRAQRSTA